MKTTTTTEADLFFNLLCKLVLGYPAFAAGYVWAELKSGFEIGQFVARQHEEAAIEKFCD